MYRHLAQTSSQEFWILEGSLLAVIALGLLSMLFDKKNDDE